MIEHVNASKNAEKPAVPLRDGGEMLGMIACADLDDVIAVDGNIPWREAADLRHFRRTTAERAIIMGRATWDSLPPAFRPLPRRTNIVLSTTMPAAPQGALLCRTLSEAVREAHRRCYAPYVIGGARLYREAMPYAGLIVLTRLPYLATTARAHRVLRFPKIPRAFERATSVAIGDGLTVEHYIRRQPPQEIL